MRALIVGSESARGSLAAARSLTRNGWIVGLGSPQRGLTSGSRSIFRSHVVPTPQQDLKTFVKAINSAITAGGYEVVFGAGDAEVLALSKMRKSVRAIVPYPAHDTLLRAMDKGLLMEAARKAGLTTPREVDPSEAGLRAARYPVIVKARLHWSPEKPDAPVRLEATIARSYEDAISIVERLEGCGATPLIQEMIEGELLAYSALVGNDGEVLADVQQRADAVWPPSSGVSVRAATEDIDDELRSRVVTLLRDLGWFGLAQLQFMATPGGELYLIDLNGRFYGSMALAIAAGADLAGGWANLATGRPVNVRRARAGVRYQWFEGDLRRALAEQRGGLKADVASCLAYARGAAHSVWSWRDPWPALSYATRLSGRAARKLVR